MGIEEKKKFNKLYKEGKNPKFIRNSEIYTIKYISKIKKPLRILDIGCGSGSFLRNLKRESV